MKKTPTQIAKELRTENFKQQDCIRNLKAELDKERTDCSAIFIMLFFMALSFGLGCSLYNMDKKFNEQRENVQFYAREEVIREKEREYTYAKDSFEKQCLELANISKKPFVFHYYSQEAKDFGCIAKENGIYIYNISDLNEAYRHYKLGTVK
jgi:hypothetical protein